MILQCIQEPKNRHDNNRIMQSRLGSLYYMNCKHIILKAYFHDEPFDFQSVDIVLARFKRGLFLELKLVITQGRIHRVFDTGIPVWAPKVKTKKKKSEIKKSFKT